MTIWYNNAMIAELKRWKVQVEDVLLPNRDLAAAKRHFRGGSGYKLPDELLNAYYCEITKLGLELLAEYDKEHT